MSKTAKIIILFIVVIAVGWGIGKYTSPSASREDGTNINTGADLGAEPGTGPEASALPEDADAPAATDKPAPANPSDAEMVVAEPESIAVMVNKQYSLPEKYKPADLVYPDVPFIFSEKIEKRMLRREAAEALEEMFAGAKEDGIYLAGVSGYRSEATQRRLFNNYVDRDGEEKARTYSALPGHSEHQTGLAIDLSGSDGKCAAESCFAGTKEAEWLAAHAAEYGYIIRFLEGKEAITGYIYEPWHVRYVGKEIAASVTERGITLEEYYDAVPVAE
ncbi:M15 family metallopeptidase [Paenibacillus tritici]|uniref:M15 family metallopeptidase n=1 Tax=Paenibacillus tritici TaxID=1873425 RepID=A0ABX2DR06_9BACL|nr:M15 family metallopeptidase [Paenibacillus tritici]NQX47098.1 M15 family metallopeptidase [Paenibacillus tritici]